MRLFVIGPSSGGKIQLPLYGADAEELRNLAGKAENILLAESRSRAVRNEWCEKIKVVRPQIAEIQARKIGIGRPEMAHTLEATFQGTKVDVYREQDELLPIVARAPMAERIDLDNLDGIQVWSPTAKSMIPKGQVVSDFNTEFEVPYVWRLDRRKMLRIHADPREGLPSELFSKVKAKLSKQ